MRATYIGLVGLLLIAAAACGNAHERKRCVQCGMPIDDTSRWNSGLSSATGEALHFDTPKCLFGYLRSEQGRGASLPWFTEYYSQERRPATSLRFVVGSDLIGPMGPDLIPVEGEAAALRFAADHSGQDVLAFEAVDAAQLHSLDPP